MKYLTYAEYIGYGGSLDETAFNDLEYEARMYIDWYTFRRLHAPDTKITDEVKECMYHLMKIIQNRLDALNIPVDGDGVSSSIGAGIASQSNDGVSISYNVLSAKEVIDASSKELDEAINRYLQGMRNSLGHRLLFRGIYPGEEVY